MQFFPGYKQYNELKISRFQITQGIAQTQGTITCTAKVHGCSFTKTVKQARETKQEDEALFQKVLT